MTSCAGTFNDVRAALSQPETENYPMAPPYVPPRRKVTLDVTGHPDLEIVVRSPTLAEYFNVVELSRQLDGGTATATAILDTVVEWNLAEPHPTIDGAVAPLDVSLESYMKQERPLCAAINVAWIQASAGISAPLVRPSADGKPSVAQSLKTEPL